MHCCDTGATIPAVRLEHIDVKTATRLDAMIGKLKRLVHGDARILLILSGGKVQDMEPSTKLKVTDD